MQSGIPLYVDGLVPLVSKKAGYVDRCVHFDPAHVFPFALRAYFGFSHVIDEFPRHIQGDQGGISQKEKYGHCERELGGGIPGGLVVDGYLEDHLRDGLKEKFHEDLDLKTVF